MINIPNAKFVLVIALSAALGTIVSGTVVFGHGQKHNPTRHHYMMKNGVPAAYEGRLNPFDATAENLTSGESLYRENCVACHGATGKSDTEAAKELNPLPAVLAGMYDRTMMGMGSSGSEGHMMHGMMHHHPGMSHTEAMGGLNLDAYNFWAISEGGEPIGSAMPGFKEALSEKERWQILLYVANNFSAKRGG